MMEVWKDISGFPGYQVSATGKVRTYNKVTYNRHSGVMHWRTRILKQKIAKGDGRARVTIWREGQAYTFLVHRLQAIAFLGEPPNEAYTVNHKDGNPLNNVVENLEWVTRADNIRYGFENGQYPTCHPITLSDGGKDYTFYSKSAADRFLGRREGYICGRIAKGEPVLISADGKQYSIKAEG